MHRLIAPALPGAFPHSITLSARSSIRAIGLACHHLRSQDVSESQSFAAEPVSLDSPLPSPARGFGSLPHRALQILGLVEVFRRIEADRRDQLGRVEIGAGEIRIGERDPSEVRTRK